MRALLPFHLREFGGGRTTSCFGKHATLINSTHLMEWSFTMDPEAKLRKDGGTAFYEQWH